VEPIQSPAGPPPEPGGGEYGEVSLPELWHVASLAFFLAALGARFVVELVPAALRPLPKPLLSAVAVPVLAGCGLALGLVGLGRVESRGIARIAVFLNAVALVLSALALAAYLYILPKRF